MEATCRTGIVLSNIQWEVAHQEYKLSSSCKNFASHILLHLFDHRMLEGRNCSGFKKEKVPDDFQAIVRYLCYTFFSAEMISGPYAKWRDCQKSMDEMLRRNKRKDKKYDTQINIVNS